MSPRVATVAALASGALLVIAATAAGRDGAFLDALVRPPTTIRAALIGGSVALAIALLSRSLTRLAAGANDIPSLVRGVRLAFLAVAAGSAAAGWAIGDALPIVVGLVIAGIDVVETSLLLLIVLRRQPGGPTRPG